MYYTEDFEQVEEIEEIDQIASYHLPRPNKVREKLFIGCQDSAHNRLFLKTHKISHILNLTGIKTQFQDNFIYLNIENLDDSPTQDILSYFPSCISFIDQGIQEGTGVLVHCAAGISRSSSIIVAYLMKKENLFVEEALSSVRNARPIVSPNCGFMKQLKMWDEMNYTLEGNSKAHRLFKLQKLSIEFSQFGTIPQLQLEEDKNIQLDFDYSCKNCQKELFTELNIIDHIKGVSIHGKRWCEDKECNFLFLEPLSWMGELTKEFGELLCPKCGIYLGNWTWASSKCSCLTTVSPSFKIFRENIYKRKEKTKEIEALNSFS